MKLCALTCGNRSRHDETKQDIARKGLLVPARMTLLNPADGPLMQFAVALRQLRDNAPADRTASVPEVVRECGNAVSKAAIFAAMSGKVLPSRLTLKVMVLAWAPGREQDLQDWMVRRSQCERSLASTARRVLAASSRAIGSADQHPGSFGPELRRLRQQRGYSLTQLGTALHYSKGYLSRVESGRRPPQRDLALAADAFLGSDGLLGRLFPE